jgi:hypothetical protein
MDSFRASWPGNAAKGRAFRRVVGRLVKTGQAMRPDTSKRLRETLRPAQRRWTPKNASGLKYYCAATWLRLRDLSRGEVQFDMPRDASVSYGTKSWLQGLKPCGSGHACGGTEVPPFRRQARHGLRDCNPAIWEHTSSTGLLALLADEACDGVHEIKFGEDFKFCAWHFNKDRGAIVAEDVGDSLNGSVRCNLRERGAHHFADD